MVETSDTSCKNEIHRIDSPFNNDSKNIKFFPREILISWEVRLKNLEKMDKNRKIYRYADYGVQNFAITLRSSPP